MNARAGLRGGAVGKVLVVEVWGPGFGFSTPGKKWGVVACACNPSAGGTETGECLGLAEQAVLLNQWVLGSQKDPVSERWSREKQKRLWLQPLTSMPLNTLAQEFTQIQEERNRRRRKERERGWERKRERALGSLPVFSKNSRVQSYCDRLISV